MSWWLPAADGNTAPPLDVTVVPREDESELTPLIWLGVAELGAVEKASPVVEDEAVVLAIGRAVDVVAAAAAE